MNSERFNAIVDLRCDSIKRILASKALEYAKGDRLSNFKVAARIRNKTPEESLDGMMMKHLVCVFDLIDNPELATNYLVNEKIGDLINYLILLEAMLIERIEKDE